MQFSFLRAILQESEAKLEMKIFTPPSFYCVELGYLVEGCSSYLLGVKNAVLLALRVLKLKRSTTGAFPVPYKVLTLDNVL